MTMRDELASWYIALMRISSHLARAAWPITGDAESDHGDAVRYAREGEGVS